jgi:signal transduction histidine kinase/HAMP domain-containing protein
MGTASGVVAALVATVFAVLVNAVRDLRNATDRAQSSERAVVAASELRALVREAQLGRRAYLRVHDPSGLVVVRKAQSQLRAQEVVLTPLARQDSATSRQLDALRPTLDAYISQVGVLPARPSPRGPVADTATSDAQAATLGQQLTSLVTAAGNATERRRADADSSASRAVALGVGGMIGSAALIALLTTYLTQYIIVPLRRVGRAARRLAAGDLGTRVVEEGDAEPVELARSFNAMAASLEHSRDELESQNAELAAQQGELEQALGELASEKRRVEVFHRAGEHFAAELDLDTLAEIALRELCDAAGAEVGALYAATAEDPSTDAGREAGLTLVASRGLDPSRLQGTLGPHDGLAGRAARERRPIAASRPEGDLEVLAFGRPTPVRYELHAPLRLGERVVGVISLARLAERPFDYEQVETVERLADQAAVAFANVLSYRRAVRQAQINRAVLEATPDPIGLFGLGGELVVENAPMSAVRALSNVDAPGDSPEREVRDELALAQRTYARYAAPVLDARGSLMGRIVVLRDVTAERESERLKDEFFALVSHELRTPLTSIIGYLELVLDESEELSSESRRFLEVVERNAKRLLRLVGDMLFVAQVEAGRLSLERVAIDLGQVAAESVEAARPSAERAGVELVLVTEPLPSIVGDGDRFGQMIDNLVSNALKFTPAQGTVSVRISDAGDHAQVAVTDTGMGIPLGEQERLFERFYRATGAVERAVPGVGLGLTIVKTIAEAHGGSVELRSREGSGTTFRVCLPYTPELGSSSADPASTPEAIG